MPDANLLESIRTKFSRYTAAECDYAKRDCMETLKLHPANSDYSAKLWAEIDAANTRLAHINRTVPCSHCRGTGRAKPC